MSVYWSETRLRQMMRKKLLIVEDSQPLLANLYAYLEPRDYQLDSAQDGATGLHLAVVNDYDAIVLDWMLPRLDGEELLRRARDRGVATPVLMLTARDDLPHKIAGFQAGADDYLTKPFALAELEVRLDALILRSRGRENVLQVADLRFDVDAQVVSRGGKSLQLRSGGRKLLELLMRESPAVVKRERLEFALWGDESPDRDVLRAHIYDLRKSVDGPFTRKLIKTIPKVGYKLG